MASHSGNVRPRMHVLSPESVKICEAHSYGRAANIDSCILPTSGVYTIAASDLGATNTGAYGLSLQRLNGPVGATSLSFGQNLADALVADGEIDTYTIAANQNDVIVLRMSSTASTLKPLIRLYRADGALLCSAYSYGAIAELSNCVAPATETYTILVTAFADSTVGTYSLAVQRPNNPVAAQPLLFGQPTLATLATMAELDAYTFNANQEDTVVLRMGRATGGLKPQVRVYGPTGTLLCGNSSYGAVTGAICLIPVSGTYTVLSSAFNDPATGSYGLTIQRVNAPPNATPLAAGITATSALTAAGQLATYTFAGAANHAVYLRMGAINSAIKPEISVYGDNGALICSKYTYGATVDVGPCLLPRTGMYTVLVNSFDVPATGGYGLTFQRITAPEQATTLYFGAPSFATLNSPASIGAFQFTAAASSSVRLRMTTGSALNPVIQIFSADGTKLCSSYSYGAAAEIATCQLPFDGDYTILATSLNDATGPYTLSLTCLNGTCGAVTPPFTYVFVPFVRR